MTSYGEIQLHFVWRAAYHIWLNVSITKHLNHSENKFDLLACRRRSSSALLLPRACVMFTITFVFEAKMRGKKFDPKLHNRRRDNVQSIRKWSNRGVHE